MYRGPIAYNLVGGSSKATANRRIHDRWLTGASAINDACEQAWNRGFRRVHFHNYYGAMLGEDMQLDQYWHMRKENDGRFDAMLDSKAVAAVCRKWKAEGMEIIFYLGALRHDTDFDFRKFEADNAIYRIYMSLRMPLDGGCSIGLDVASFAQPGDLTYGVLMMLKGLGVRYYVEPALPTNNPWVTQDTPVIMSSRFFEGRMPSPDYSRSLDEDCVIIRTDVYGGDMVDGFNRILARGATPMVPSSGEFKVSDDGTILEAE